MTIVTKRINGASPLRYPGGKSALTGFISQIIQDLCLDEPTYVEPYAGGAGAALALLDAGTVKRIVINDLDPAIFAFWNSAVNHSDDFLELFDATKLTLEEWDRQKAIYKACDTSRELELGFATFFLNRTNRSGVLNAGVIGGRAQAGTYKLDARYNKVKLHDRLSWLGTMSGSITVTNHDGIECLKENLGTPETFVYADPPYFDKGSYLYLNAFGPKDHENLAKLLKQHPTALWLLSYDRAPEILSLYKGLSQRSLALNYSAHRTGVTEELLVVSRAVAPMVYEKGFTQP